TKPTQHSVAALRSIGIQPDAIVLRSDRELPASVKAKISSMCDVDLDAVVTCADAPSIYEIPQVLHTEGLDAYAIRRLDLLSHDVDWSQSEELLRRVHHPAYEVTVALVGKYVDLPDAYLSVTEALRAGGFHHSTKVHLRWVESDLCTSAEGAPRQLRDADATVGPGGSPSAASTGRTPRSTTPAPMACPRPDGAWACSRWSSSTPATSWASRTRTPQSSPPRPP